MEDENVIKAIERGIISFSQGRITYHLKQNKSYRWNDPEEWVRARTIAFLIIEKGYPTNRIKTEVRVPRRTPNDFADIVVYEDDRCQTPYLVVENKASGQNNRDRQQGVEQAFGNTNSLRAPFALYDEFSRTLFYDVGNFPPEEREENNLGTRDRIPEQYGNAPEYVFIAGGERDIEPARSNILENKIKRAHSIIWSGGRRDPLTAFDEWSKLLFTKVIDERNTPTGEPRKFQVGTSETTATVANRIHSLYAQGKRDDPTIFRETDRIDLPDKKIFDVVQCLQDISFTQTDVDSIGLAFENFFGSVFRGELGQYFTMRPLSRFTVSMLSISHTDFVLDPTAGSGGFLLEALLQVWHDIDERFSGQNEAEIERIKTDFALHRVYGIEIHEILARICKINLLLHHDGHTNIVGDKSCLDTTFDNPRLNPPRERFTMVVGNPPFGDSVEEGDEDHLGENSLENFTVAAGRSKIASEHVIIERSVDFLEPGGKFGLVIPDGLLNNQGEQSNCPQLRNYLVRNGYIQAIISLPDFAFRKSGAQNKTSILFFQKFTCAEKRRFDLIYQSRIDSESTENEAIIEAYQEFDYHVFLAEANHIGYTTTGAPTNNNQLYQADEHGRIIDDQPSTVLGQYRLFQQNPETYEGQEQPDCMGLVFSELWNAHSSHRLDPKYHLFKREESTVVPDGWIRLPLGQVLERREEIALPQENPNEEVKVLTISQTGELRLREAGKGKNPPAWLGMYFEDSPSKWYSTHENDVVFSSIDLWKGCASVVKEEFAGALVTKEFPIYRITDNRLDSEFLSYLLRSRYYQRAFRAITTGHSNRRRTQTGDFENLEISFPPSIEEQRALIETLNNIRRNIKDNQDQYKREYLQFSDLLDHRGDEVLPDLNKEEIENE
ncbi:N-6 DNA methylase [bacterium]|nr:N-6 DNA methylase [bacterium]